MTAETVHVTSREKEILHWMSNGKSIDEIGLILGVTAHTVNSHKNTLKTKLDVYKDTALVATALRRHIIE